MAAEYELPLLSKTPTLAENEEHMPTESNQPKKTMRSYVVIENGETETKQSLRGLEEEDFAVLPVLSYYSYDKSTTWTFKRSFAIWRDPKIFDEIGDQTQFEFKNEGFFFMYTQLIDKLTNQVVYSCRKKFSVWKPYEIYIGDSEEQLYASINNSLTFFGMRFKIEFTNGDDPIYLTANWCNRIFELKRNNIVIATIKRQGLINFHYTIKAGENIPFMHLMVHVIGFLATRLRK